jgi:hypothetical protein
MINIKSLWESQKPTGDIIIKTRIKEIEHLFCFAATNHITGQHLYIMEVSNKIEIPELKNYHFKGVQIFSIEVESRIELHIYLLDNELKDIFSLFIQNILEDIQNSISENEAITTTLNVVSKWKKLFDKINFKGLSIEQQKGLIGELLFFNYALNNGKTTKSVLAAWTGADYEAKDFSFGSLGIEIKFTSSKQPRIKVSNERQLDIQNISELFLVLYSTEEVKENGFSLNSLVEHTQQMLSNEEELNEFNAKLQMIGYIEDDRDYYTKRYSIKNTFSFTVPAEFPKITKDKLPLGIYDASYSIEISAVESFIIDLDSILKKV